MDDSTPSTNNDRFIHRSNQILSGVVACAVLGVGGVMAYQSRDALKVPDRNAAWAGFWTKKLSDTSRIPKFDGPEFPAKIDWEKVEFDPSKTMASGLQSNPGFSGGGNSSSSLSRRR